MFPNCPKWSPGHLGPLGRARSQKSTPNYFLSKRCGPKFYADFSIRQFKRIHERQVMGKNHFGPKLACRAIKGAKSDGVLVIYEPGMPKVL